jgi:OOP family OmpA-OmpF porin
MRFVFTPARLFLTACAAALPLLAPAPAAAQSVAEPGTWTVTPFLGGTMGLDVPAGGNSLVFGVGAGYDITSNIGVEGEIGHLFDIAGDDDLIDRAVTTYSGNFVYHFDVRHVTPYATIGIGLERSAINDDGEALLGFEDSTEVAFNFGGGVKYPIARNILVRGDLRRFESNDLAPDYWRVYAGLTFTFGRP